MKVAAEVLGYCAAMIARTKLVFWRVWTIMRQYEAVCGKSPYHKVAGHNWMGRIGWVEVGCQVQLMDEK